MTHLYAYIKKGSSEAALQKLVANLKAAVTDGLNLRETSSTVAVKELPETECSDNLGALILVYTAKGKGYDSKRVFAKMVNDGVREALGDVHEVKMIIKEHANDMVGVNGVLRSLSKDVNADYEEN